MARALVTQCLTVLLVFSILLIQPPSSYGPAIAAPAADPLDAAAAYAATAAGSTERASLSTTGEQGNAHSSSASISADGRYVVFESAADNLVPGDGNSTSDVFVYDRLTDKIELVSVSIYGGPGNDESSYPSISDDGRYVAFKSFASDLVNGDVNANADIFVYDRHTGETRLAPLSGDREQVDRGCNTPVISGDGGYVVFQTAATNLVTNVTHGVFQIYVYDLVAEVTELVSVSINDEGVNASSWFPSISDDGRYVAFRSQATDLVDGDTNGEEDVFVRDRQLGTTELVSVSIQGGGGNGNSDVPSISGDGRYVAFASGASDLVSGDMNGMPDVFVRDRQLGTTELVSLATAGSQGNSFSYYPSISDDGRYVAFWSGASDLVSGDMNGMPDVFVRDRQLGTTELVSVSSEGAQGNNLSGHPSISDDGRIVAFTSPSTNLVSGGTNGNLQIFARDRDARTTELVSASSSSVEGNAGSDNPSISADGRFVAFASDATNLIRDDTNGKPDIYVRDRETGVTERVSVPSGDGEANGYSVYPSISLDGRFVTFTSEATNLVGGDTNGRQDVFIHDRQTGVTELVSISTDKAQGNGNSFGSSISADGRFVAFQSYATNLAGVDTDDKLDLFVRDRELGTTECVSVSSGGVKGNASSWSPSISADGRYVAFWSSASNLVDEDQNGSQYDIFVHDRKTGATELVSVATSGEQGNGPSNYPSISADGRFVAFQSYASNLVSGDTNGEPDIFVHDRLTGVTELVSVSTSGKQGNDDCDWPSISADGRFVTFHSFATTLVSGDTNGMPDIFVHDRQSGVTELVSVSSSGEQANGTSSFTSISAGGRFVAFDSWATNLVNDDTNGVKDIFVRDRCPDGSCGEGYALSGRIADPTGAGLADVTLTVLDPAGSVATIIQTNSNGEYQLYWLPAGTYRLIPNKISHTFLPDLLTVQIDRARVGQDFLGMFVSCGEGNAACPLPFAAPFLDLPVDYADFTDAALGYQDPSPGGRVMSWFDHARADDAITRIWDGRSSPAMDAATCQPRSACYEGHEGIDFNRITLPVKAAAGGTVIETVTGCADGDACGDGLGNQVWVDHGNGYVTLYGHLAPGSVQVEVGDEVSQGQAIGVMGDHLHFTLLFDANGDGAWDRTTEMVDRYGWNPPDMESDPWTVPSLYLWEHPLNTYTYVDAEGGTCAGPAGDKSASLPAGATGDNLLCSLGEASAPAGPGDSSLRIVSSFYLRFWQDLLSPAGGGQAMDLAGPYSLSVTYAPEALDHLDWSKVQLYHWDAGGEAWTALPTSLDPGWPSASADTELSGDFTLQAPLVCPADTAEPYNDAPALALAYPQTTLPQVAHHLFDIAGDEDWTAFTAKAGRTYSIRTQALASGVDTVLQVYAADGVTELGKDDNGGGGKASHLIWTAPESGVYHVRVSQAAGSAYGCNSGYDLRIAEPGGEQLFLPLLAR